MPFYRFTIEGRGVRTATAVLGFFTTRSAFGRDEHEAAKAAIAAVHREWIKGAASSVGSPPTEVRVDRMKRIRWYEIWTVKKRGYTFYPDTPS